MSIKNRILITWRSASIEEVKDDWGYMWRIKNEYSKSDHEGLMWRKWKCRSLRDISVLELLCEIISCCNWQLILDCLLSRQITYSVILKTINNSYRRFKVLFCTVKTVDRVHIKRVGRRGAISFLLRSRLRFHGGLSY